MGLLTVLRKVKQKEHQVRILLLGLDNAGKTTLLKRLIGDLIPNEDGTTIQTNPDSNNIYVGESNIHPELLETNNNLSRNEINVNSKDTTNETINNLNIDNNQVQNIEQTEPKKHSLNLETDNTELTTESTATDSQFVQSSTNPTLGFNIRSFQHAGFKINIWDIGGQKSIRSYWKNYFEDTDAIIWVIDSADVSDIRLQDSKRELESVLSEDRLSGASLLILCNKQDLPGALSPTDIMETLDIQDTVGDSRHWHAIGCSATTNLGSRILFEAIDWLISDISHKVYLSN